MGEVTIAAALCGLLAGSAVETNHYFDVNWERRHVEVDCETPTHVIEIGLDQKPDSRDSVHQALLAAYLTDFRKIPAVILIDRDDEEGKYELEMRRVTGMLGLAYATCSDKWIKAWQARGGMRVVPDGTNDLPKEAWATSACDLSQIVGPDVVMPEFIKPELPVTGVVGVSAPLDREGE